VGATRRIRPAAGFALSIVVSAALAGGAAAWLAPGDPELGLSRQAKRAEVSLPPAPNPRQTAAPGSGRRPGVPASISIPAAGSSGPVDRMGVEDGELEIPPAGRAGWFAGGPRPGELGRAVIVSHVDSKEGPALFYSLLQQPLGSRITVRDRRGAVHRFAVVRRRQIEKSHFPAGSVYGASARPMLVLVTCGGPFSPDTGYRDNVILYARAV
jgi:hypothetical protein